MRRAPGRLNFAKTMFKGRHAFSSIARNRTPVAQSDQLISRGDERGHLRDEVQSCGVSVDSIAVALIHGAGRRRWLYRTGDRAKAIWPTFAGLPPACSRRFDWLRA